MKRGEKSVAMIRVEEINKVTGYIRGGCSPVGMKKRYPTAVVVGVDGVGDLPPVQHPHGVGLGFHGHLSFPIIDTNRGALRSPVGMKKRYPTVIDSRAAGLGTMVVSGGRIGTQVELDPGGMTKTKYPPLLPRVTRVL